MPGAALQLTARGGTEWGANMQRVQLAACNFLLQQPYEVWQQRSNSDCSSARSTKDNRGPQQPVSVDSPARFSNCRWGTHTNGVDGGGTLNLAENGQQCARGAVANFTAHKKSRDQPQAQCAIKAEILINRNEFQC